MSRTSKIYNRWRYRRLFRKLFFLYAQKHKYADAAGQEAAIAFQWLSGFEYNELFNGSRKPDV